VRAVDRGLNPAAIDAAPAGAGGVTRTLRRRPILSRPLFETLPAAVAPRVQPSLERRHLWERRFRRRLDFTDTVSVTVAVAAATVVEAGPGADLADLAGPARIGAFVIAAWMVLLWLA